MIFKLHYWFMAAGANALGILLGVFLANYTDATPTEIGFVYMLMPFCTMISKPLVCSYADRKRAHQKCLMYLLLISSISYLPFVIIPMLGPDLYLAYPRFCWYCFLVFKIAGDMAFGGASSIGDSLAINYAHRVGTNFAVYRVWATISWMVFGVLVGQINEIWFLPKYVPAFMILISASLLDMFVIWLWPPEYFLMVPVNETLKRKTMAMMKTGASNTAKVAAIDQAAAVHQKPAAAASKVLMPRAVVWAHARGKLISLLTCSCASLPASGEQTTASGDGTKAIASAAAAPTENGGGGGSGGNATNQITSETKKSEDISRSTQISILMLLLKRDPRISLYLAMFVCAGASVTPVSFFFMHLSELCHATNKCDYSQLGGFLQAAMALPETILFVYIKQIMLRIGRLNTASLAFGLAFIKFGFYATIWPSVNPYFSLVSEMATGLIFATHLTLMVELAHSFSTEVEFLIPELISRGIVRSNDQASCNRLKMSLSATMQALMSSANDGFGRGVSALIYGVILDHYSYDTLWKIIAVGAGCVCLILQSINLFDNCLGLKLGLDEQFYKSQTDGDRSKLESGRDNYCAELGDDDVSASIQSRGETTTTTTTDASAANGNGKSSLQIA